MMEKQLSACGFSNTLKRERRKYVCPDLSLVSFSSEKGFATSVFGDTSHYDYPEETTNENNYKLGSGTWDI